MNTDCLQLQNKLLQSKISEEKILRIFARNEQMLAEKQSFPEQNLLSLVAGKSRADHPFCLQGKGNAKVPGLYWEKKNPNSSRKSTGNRKKKAC